MGYATGGLEAWTYPLQLVSGYTVGFRSAGETTEVSGFPLLRRVTYEAQAVTRTYIGADFIVRERLFVPLNEQAILLSYTVESQHAVDIIIHFTPVLDLMWPRSLGGQSAQWNPAASAYVLTEGRQQYAAIIGSPSITSHDAARNTAEPGALGNRLAFVLHGNPGHTVTVVVAQMASGAANAAQRMNDLIREQPGLEREAREHYASVAADALRIITPDPVVNQQLAWAEVALDQAWVCNPVLGCGLVAGYGPSRNARRPQYDWFFAGDGLIAERALLSAGGYNMAREELAFIAKYQDPNTGMVWHEMSQSADPASWAREYPYMFVHVDITFQYLIAVEQYVSASGDNTFLEQHWAGIEAAYRYCASSLNPSDGLPRIPANKLGGDEQDKITEDLSLSISWVAASSAFSRLARLSGHASQADDALRASERARSAAATHYWDDARHQWIDGYNQAGAPIRRRGDGGVRLLGILDQARSDSLLDQLASAAFQTDWGTRGVATDSTQFDPSSYAKGSVSAMASGGVAEAFWSQHRPVTAFSIWSALLPWGTLDSMGHMHELLAGDFYHQQAESVPEQTWSSAAFLSSTVHGLLGLERAGQTNRLVFAPHLPPVWQEISVDNIKVSGGQVALTLSRVADGLVLAAENSGAPVELHFSPEIPLGARLLGAQWNGRPVRIESETHPQDMHAAFTVMLPGGKSRGLVRYTGGVSISVTGPAPQAGESSRSIKLTSVTLKGDSLVLGADVPRLAALESSIALRTGEEPTAVHGATLNDVSPGVYSLIPSLPPGALERGIDSVATPYQHMEITVELAPRAGK